MICNFVAILYKNSNTTVTKKRNLTIHCAWGRGPWVANMAQSPSPLTNEICQLSFIPTQPESTLCLQHLTFPYNPGILKKL